MTGASESHSTVVPPDRGEERRERRYQAPEGVKLKLQPSPEADAEEAELRDISLRGFGITIARYIAPGSVVLLRMGTQRIEAEVRHCSAWEQRYRAGVVVYRTASERPQPADQRDWDNLLVRSRRSRLDG